MSIQKKIFSHPCAHQHVNENRYVYLLFVYKHALLLKFIIVPITFPEDIMNIFLCKIHTWNVLMFDRKYELLCLKYR